MIWATKKSFSLPPTPFKKKKRGGLGFLFWSGFFLCLVVEFFCLLGWVFYVDHSALAEVGE